MLFMGIDPGYGRTGYAFIENDKKNQLTAVSWGVLETDQKAEHPQRLLELYNNINVIIDKFSPKSDIVLAAVEEVFFRKNLTTGVKLLQARGVLLLSLAQHNIPVAEITPTEMKKMISGSGTSSKQIIKKIVTRLLALELNKENKSIPDDAYDALAIAVGAWMQYRTRYKLLQRRKL